VAKPTKDATNTIKDSFAELTKTLLNVPFNRVKNLGKNLQQLATDVNNLPKVDADKLEWAKHLKDIKIPHIGHVGNMFISNLTNLANAIDNLPKPGAGKLAWAEDLSKIKVPHLSGVGNMFIRDLRTLATEIDQLPTPDKDKLSWVENLKNIKVPRLSGVSNFIKNIRELAQGLTGIQEDFGNPFEGLDDLADIGKLGDASINIGFGSTLDKIEAHLAVLAGLKGVIWA